MSNKVKIMLVICFTAIIVILEIILGNCTDEFIDKTSKQLEDLNINGLDEQITLCNKKKCPLSTVIDKAFTAIELMSVHFNSSEEIIFEKLGSSRKNVKKPKARPVKEEQTPQIFPVPPPHTIDLVCNAFNSPLSKSEYLSKYGQVTQAWTNPECQLAPSFLHRLIYSFLKVGNSLEGVDSLVESLTLFSSELLLS